VFNKVDLKLNDANKEKNQLAQLIEKARQYAKVLKDFQEVNLIIVFIIYNIYILGYS
jgi:hypothetical protein